MTWFVVTANGVPARPRPGLCVARMPTAVFPLALPDLDSDLFCRSRSRISEPTPHSLPSRAWRRAWLVARCRKQTLGCEFGPRGCWRPSPPWRRDPRRTTARRTQEQELSWCVPYLLLPWLRAVALSNTPLGRSECIGRDRSNRTLACTTPPGRRPCASRQRPLPLPCGRPSRRRECDGSLRRRNRLPATASRHC